MVKKCSFCGTLNPDDANYCVNCKGALSFSSRFRSWGLRAKHAPTRVKTWGKKKALAVIGGGPQGGPTTRQKFSGWWQKRKEAQAAAPPESKTLPEYFARAPGSPMFNTQNVGKMGLWIFLVLLLVGVLFFLAFFVGGLFASIPLYWLIILIGILLFIALLFKHNAGAAVMVLIIFGALGYGAWYLQYTPLGQEITGKIQVGGIGAVQQFQVFMGPLNVMNQIFRGTYTLENLWRSDTIQSQYVTVKDVGVVLLNVKPLREKFGTTEKPIIRGTINAVAFPGQNATAEIHAYCSSEALPGTGVQDCNPKYWTCTSEKFTNIREVRNRAFSCELSDTLGAGVYSVEVKTTAKDTMTVAGKQFVFANPDVAVTLDDPLKTWGVSSDSLKSWQKGDEALNVGIGAVGDPTYLETAKSQSDLDYYIGVNIENPASNTGTITDAPTVVLFVPKQIINMTLPDGTLFNNALGEPDFQSCKPAKPADLAAIGINAIDVSLYKCTASNVPGDIKPGDRRTALLKVKISKDSLYGADFGTFFVLAKVTYDYENKQLLALQVE